MTTDLTIRTAPREVPEPYLTVSEAASLYGCSTQYMRRLCDQRFAPADMARRFGQAWGIHPNADPKLCKKSRDDRRERDNDQIAHVRLNGDATAHQAAVAAARRDIVIGYERFEYNGRGSAVDRAKAWLSTCKARGMIGNTAVVKRCAVRTLYRWQSDYRSGGINALIRSSEGGRKRAKIGESAWLHIQAILLAGNGLSVRSAYEITLGHAVREHPGDPEWTVPKYRTLLKIVEERIPAGTWTLANKGRNAFRAQHIPKLTRDYDNIPACEEWVGDERTLDIQCRVMSRRGEWKRSRKIVITAWMDMRSRYIVGYVIHDFADSNTILASLRQAIATHGKPRTLIVDWGRDYRKAVGHIHTHSRVPKSKRFTLREFDGERVGGVLDQLDITVRPTTPYTPWPKPIEPFFGVMKRQFDALFPSYWGGSSNERHEDRERWTRKNLAKLPTLDDIRVHFAKWVTIYHNKPKTGVGMNGLTPAQAINEYRDGPARMESDAALEHMFLTYSEPRLVKRDGMQWLGKLYGWGDEWLHARIGQKFLLAIDPNDVSVARVCDVRTRQALRTIYSGDNIAHSLRDVQRRKQLERQLTRKSKDQIGDAREYFQSTTLSTLMTERALGVEELNGLPEPTTPPLRLVAARPGLEQGIADAGPIKRLERLDPEEPDELLEEDDFIDNTPTPGDAGDDDDYIDDNTPPAFGSNRDDDDIDDEFVYDDCEDEE